MLDGAGRRIRQGWVVLLGLAILAGCDDSVTGENGGETPGEANLWLASVAVDPEQVYVDESVTVVATVQNGGDAAGSMELEFTVNGDAQESRSVTVQPPADGQSPPDTEEEVQFTWSSAEPGTFELAVNGTDAGTVTVGKEPASDIQLLEADLTPSTVYVDEEVTVTAWLENTGNADGSKEVELLVDGAPVASDQVEVAAGGQGEVSFNWSSSTPGHYELALNQTGAGTVVVEEIPQPDIVVTDAQADPTTVLEGEPVTITASAENQGDAEGEKTLELRVDGSAVESTTVALDAGDGTEVSFTWSTNTPGEYELAVNDVDAGTVTVEEAPEADISITSVSASPSTVEVGETVTITIELENAGDAEGRITLTFTVDGSTEETDMVTLGAGSQTSHTFTWSTNSTGNYEMAVNGVDAGTVTVEESPAELEITSISVNPSEPVETMEAAVTGEVTNSGGSSGSLQVTLRVDGQSLTSQTVQVSAGSTESVGFTWTPQDAGSRTVSLNNESLSVDVLAAVELVNTFLPVEEMYLNESPVPVAVTVLNRTDEVQQFEMVTEVFTFISGQPRWVELDRIDPDVAPGEHTGPAAAFQAPDGQTGAFPAEFPIRVNGQDSGVVTVYAVELLDAWLGSSSVQVDEEVDVGIEMENYSSNAQSKEVVVEIQVPRSPGGPPAVWVEVDSEEMTLSGGSSFSWGDAFQISIPEPGNYPVRVNGQAIGTLEVTEGGRSR
jgi:hypothetical protein